MLTPVIPVHRRRVGFDPDPELSLLREHSPVARIELPGQATEPARAWLVTRHEDVREVLADTRRFSTALTAVGERSQGEGFLVACDPPEHTRLRRMVAAPFTVNRIRRLRPSRPARRLARAPGPDGRRRRGIAAVPVGRVRHHAPHRDRRHDRWRPTDQGRGSGGVLVAGGQPLPLAW